MKVIFRKIKKTDEIIAFFPETYSDGLIDSYMHIGGHSSACLQFYWGTIKAKEEEYFPLLQELINIVGYTDLKVAFRMSYKK